MDSTERLLSGLLLLLFSLTVQTWGQSCLLDSACSALLYQKQTSIGFSGTSDNTYISCPWRASTVAVTKTTWLFTPSTTVGPSVLDINSDPRLSLYGFTLVISNISSEQEGIYYCKVQYRDGSESAPKGAGCVFVAGRAEFRVCPDEPPSKACRGTTHLEGEEHGSVEFDARLEYNYGGDCGMKQSVRRMYLKKIDANGISDTLFVCSSVGYSRNMNCTNRTQVSITHQGEDKYDLKLSLHSLNMSSSGRYQLQVDLNEREGRISAIYKEFNVTVKARPIPTEAPAVLDCSDADPVLLLNGEVIEKDSNLTFKDIKEGGEALLCVVNNKECCGTEGAVTAEFQHPNGTQVTEDTSSTDGVYMTKGKQIVRLNYGGGSPQGGSYCCSVPASDDTRRDACVYLQF